ncbi:MAG: carboxylesterase family protein [Bacilli bacterium]|nr:carboxylesterase family protein [Bacilli bacterium]
MQKKSHIAFWILFPIAFVLLTGIVVFYFDLANGHPVWFAVALLGLVVLLAGSLMLLNFKKRWRLFPWLGFVLITGVAVAFARPSVTTWKAANYDNPVASSVITLAQGQAQGVLSKDGQVEIYAGLPYAKAPIGELRWKEPQAPEAWEGIRDASEYGPRSFQPGSNPISDGIVDIYAQKSWHPDFAMHPLQRMSEDSLYLNIYRPKTPSTLLPILVYIHGGSLTNGSSAAYDINGEAMARQGVIMITVQYRLGMFGYFAHPDLAKESPNGTTGNYGLLDQIQALKWIHENAASFGGDKNNITIAGESAGSSSVSALCVSPLSKGLFKRAIGESSSLIVSTPPHTFRSLAKAEETGKKIMAEQGCTSIEELRKIAPEQLVKTKFANSEMTLDGYALTKMPYQAYVDKENHEEALLNGYNIKEADAFVIPRFLFSPTNAGNIESRLTAYFDADTAKKILASPQYREGIEKDAQGVLNEVISVYWFIQPHHSWSQAALANGETVYRYQFTKENGYYGTYHSGEILYAYGNIERSSKGFAYDQSDKDLSKTMLSYWSNFAKSGDPNGSGLPTWNPYTGAGDKVQELGRNVGPMEDRYLSLYPIIEEFIAKR